MGLKLTAILLDEGLLPTRAASLKLFNDMGPTEELIAAVLKGESAWPSIVDVIESWGINAVHALDRMYGLKRQPEFDSADGAALLKKFMDYARKEFYRREDESYRANKKRIEQDIARDPDKLWIDVLTSYTSGTPPDPLKLKEFRFKATTRRVQITGPDYSASFMLAEVAWNSPVRAKYPDETEAKIKFLDFLGRRLNGIPLKIKRTPKTHYTSIYD